MKFIRTKEDDFLNTNYIVRLYVRKHKTEQNDENFCACAMVNDGDGHIYEEILYIMGDKNSAQDVLEYKMKEEWIL